MKTMEELYNEVVASDELKQEFLTLKADQVEGFAKAHGCDATLDEIKAFFAAKKESGELSDAELDQVAGGKGPSFWEGCMSVFGLGLVCVGMVLVSVDSGDCGTAIEGEGMLCKMDEEDAQPFGPCV